ncbi:hypothetical protein JW964_03420 [candidate division KSB1 bacterium]|nr:hypothetical protein [candidate division KSB1 bacterium]
MELEKFNKTVSDFLLEAYKSRVQFRISQGERVWTRFNYFLGIEIGLFALFFIPINPLRNQLRWN